VIVNAPGDKRWMHALTYSGHPTACAVGLANIAILERENLVERAAQQGARLNAQLRSLCALPHVGDVRGLGLMAGVELVEDKASKKSFDAAKKTGERVLRECASRGLVSRVRGDIVCIAPAFVVTDEQIDRIVNILGESVSAVANVS
jgi:adenosylmethionine-8-amino-7-oxononanoate aminotransferase